MNFFKKKEPKFKVVEKSKNLHVKTQVVMVILNSGERKESVIESKDIPYADKGLKRLSIMNGRLTSAKDKNGVSINTSVPQAAEDPYSDHIHLNQEVVEFSEGGVIVQVKTQDVKEIKKMPVQLSERTFPVKYKVLEPV